MRSAKTLIRLRGCAGWSESSRVAQVLLKVLSCAASLMASNGLAWRMLKLFLKFETWHKMLELMSWFILKTSEVENLNEPEFGSKITNTGMRIKLRLFACLHSLTVLYDYNVIDETFLVYYVIIFTSCPNSIYSEVLIPVRPHFIKLLLHCVLSSVIITGFVSTISDDILKYMYIEKNLVLAFHINCLVLYFKYALV